LRTAQEVERGSWILKIPPIVAILSIQFTATRFALCRILTEYGVDHEELHDQIESDWMEVMLALKWAINLDN
jgi:hypothetical protein